MHEAVKFTTTENIVHIVVYSTVRKRREDNITVHET